jgi:hypothetical protein
MKKFTIVFNKIKHEVQADTLPNFKNAVFEIINVPPESLKIIKPMIKVLILEMQNDAQFLALAAGAEITVLGTPVERIKKITNTKENGIQYVKEG